VGIEAQEERVRLDKWLWAARFYKTRSAAARAVSGGKVQLNGRRPKRASLVATGDRISVRKGRFEHRLVVLGLSERRGSASEAADLYEETEESRRERQRLARQLKVMPKYEFRDGGRPTKKERRELDRLRGFKKR
jgi:ribosome-associated heat shock protein Hsp15